MKPRNHRQQGFAAVAAIFLVVVLAAFGSYMVAFSNTQQITSAQDMQGTRAYWAARAGLEWGITASACSPVSTTLSIAGFQVSVTCIVTTYTEVSTNDVTLVHVNSVATLGTPGGVGYVERSISASVER